MKKVIATVLIGFSLVSTNALAWGDREQGILTGVAGLWVFQQLNKAGQPQAPVIVQQPPVIVQQPPVYVQSQPPVYVQRNQQYCESTQVTDQFGQARMITYCYVK